MEGLKSQRFRLEREADWRRLEKLLDLFEGGRGQQLSDDDVIAIPVLYRSALSSLATARAISLDQNLIGYLESLSTRAYFCVYGSRTTLAGRLRRFLSGEWRAAVKSLWRETIVAAALEVLGVVLAFVLVRRGATWFYAFVPPEFSMGRDTSTSTEDLRKILFDSHNNEGLTAFSSFLFTHNAEVALLSFALGFACGLPTAYLLFMNGLTLGALYALYVEHGLGVALGGWIFIHGITELFAITLAGAAGFRIGWSLAFPGQASRLEALTLAGRQGALVMAGVLIMLIVAGLLEGFGRQLISLTWLRYAIAIATGVGWLAFYYWPARQT
jgi:uncharacterized membrane protein SpoIIM required for sporulation